MYVCDELLAVLFNISFMFLAANIETDTIKKVNKQCLLDTPRTVRVSEKTWQVIVQTSRP